MLVGGCPLAAPTFGVRLAWAFSSGCKFRVGPKVNQNQKNDTSRMSVFFRLIIDDMKRKGKAEAMASIYKLVIRYLIVHRVAGFCNLSHVKDCLCANS